MSVKFPPELVDAIIDHLRSDKTALSSCALVSHDWVDRSRHHLLARISVTALSNTFNTEDVRLHLHAFLALLRSRPHLAQYLRQVRIESRHPKGSADGQLVPLSAIVDVLRLLPKLCELHLISVQLLDIPDISALKDLLGSFSLDRLIIYNALVSPPDSLHKCIINILSLFDSLRSLTVSGLYKGHRIHTHITAIAKKVKVNRLLLFDVYDMRLLLHILQATVEIGEVNYIGISVTDTSAPDRVNSLLKVLSPSILQSAELDLRRSIFQSHAPLPAIENLIFHPFKALDTLRLHFSMRNSKNDNERTWASLISTLSVVPQSSITTLYIHVYFRFLRNAIFRSRQAPGIFYRPILLTFSQSTFMTAISSLPNLQTTSFHVNFGVLADKEDEDYGIVRTMLMDTFSKGSWKGDLQISRQYGTWESLEGND